MSQDGKEEFVVEVRKLRLKKGDILVARCDRTIGQQTMSNLSAFIASKLPPGVEFIIADPTLAFDIITFDQIMEKKRTA